MVVSEVVNSKMQSLPVAAQTEVLHFVEFLSQKYEQQKSEEKIANEQVKAILQENGISEVEALTQRHAFSTFAEDWENPEMDIYDKL